MAKVSLPFLSHGATGFSIGFSVSSGLAASKTHFSMQGMRGEWMCYASAKLQPSVANSLDGLLAGLIPKHKQLGT